VSVSGVERVWLLVSSAVLVVFLIVLLVNAVAMSAAPPSSMDQIDPQTVLVSGPFGQPGVSQTGPRRYMVHVAAFTFGFAPSSISVPAGATVTFHIATRDVVHGFQIVGTNVNTMVIPGYVSEVTHTFTKKGTYLIVCNEYCGSGHHLMYARLTVV
jgi:cytochrome c oxidase subunit 2